MRKWVVPALSTRRLVDVTPENVETVLAHMVAEGKARRTVARVRSYLGQALACRAPRVFFRFHPVRSAGQLDGRNPLPAGWMTSEVGRTPKPAAS